MNLFLLWMWVIMAINTKTPVYLLCFMGVVIGIPQLHFFLDYIFWKLEIYDNRCVIQERFGKKREIFFRYVDHIEENKCLFLKVQPVDCLDFIGTEGDLLLRVNKFYVKNADVLFHYLEGYKLAHSINNNDKGGAKSENYFL